MKTAVVLFALLLAAVLLVACTEPVQTTDTGVVIDSKIDSNVYTITLQLEKQESHETSNAYLSGYAFSGYAGVSGRYWQEGKGLLRGKLIAVSPSVDFAKIGQTTIIKTTDLKVMGLMPGDVVQFACTVDFEPVCSKSQESKFATGNCIDIWEFDFCRIMKILPDKG